MLVFILKKFIGLLSACTIRNVGESLVSNLKYVSKQSTIQS